MTEQEWLTCNDPQRMLDYLTMASVPGRQQWISSGQSVPNTFRGASNRKLRLFCNAVYKIETPGIEPFSSERGSAREYASVPGLAAEIICNGSNRELYADLLRDIFGNPWKPVTWTCQCGEVNVFNQLKFEYCRCCNCGEYNPWLAWNDATIPRIAQSIYDDRRFEEMPILGDALEEAGCANANILNHCRGTELCSVCNRSGKVGCVHRHGVHGPGFYECENCNGIGLVSINSIHVRGCWLVDLILGRE